MYADPVDSSSARLLGVLRPSSHTVGTGLSKRNTRPGGSGDAPWLMLYSSTKNDGTSVGQTISMAALIFAINVNVAPVLGFTAMMLALYGAKGPPLKRLTRSESPQALTLV